MNFQIPHVPERPKKPRKDGLTMMMDKGLSLREAENFAESSAEFTDFVKFGFGTSAITNKLEEKLKVYREAGMRPYFGGTLFEAFAIRKIVLLIPQLRFRFVCKWRIFKILHGI